jgi:ribosomal protein S6--L-glutamate ligase
MKAAIISMGSVSSQWTAKAMEKYFDEVDHLDIKNIEISIASQPEILYNGEPIKDYDCVYAKGSFKYAMTLRAISDILKFYGKQIYLPFEPDSYTNGHDKILSHLKMIHNKVPMPKTYIASSPESGKKILEKMDYPIIMKIPSGTQGKGVMFADSYESASSMLDTLTTLRQPFLIQEYIETDSTDLRVIVVGDKIIAAMKRKGKKDDKRANIHAGGSGERIMPNDDVKKVALKAVRAIGAEICAVDILDSNIKGPLVIEVNLSPGLQGVTKATGLDVADKIAEFLYMKTKIMMDSTKNQNSKDVMTDLDESANKEACIITNLYQRGSKLILPEIAHKISGIGEDHEVEICLSKGKINIKNTS